MIPTRVVRHASAIVAIAVVATTLVACSPPAPGKTARVEIRAGNDAAAATGAVKVTIPGSSIKGQGTLLISPVKNGNLVGVSIRISNGAELSGMATLQFIYKYKAGEPTPLVGYTEPNRNNFSLVRATKNSAGAKVTTNHFSNWFVQGWNDLLTQEREALDSLFASRRQRVEPKCDNTDAALKNVVVVPPVTKQVAWCLGQSANGPVLSIANARPYIASVEATPGLSVINPPNIWENAVPSLFPFLATPGKKGNTVLLMDPGQKYNISVGPGTQAIQVNSSGAAFLVTALYFGIQTYGMLKLPAEAPKDSLALVKAMAGVSCLADYKDVATAKVTSTDQVAMYLKTAIPAVLGCLQAVLERAFANKSFLLGLVSGLAWVSAALQTLWAGVTGFLDSTINFDGWQLSLNYTPPMNPRDSSTWLITPRSIGPIPLDATAAQISAYLVRGEQSNVCQTWNSPNQDWTLFGQDIEADGRFEALFVSDNSGGTAPGPRTVTGLRFGSTEEEIRATGLIVEEINEPFRNYVIRSDGGKLGIQTFEGKLFAFAVGADRVPYEFCG